MMIGRVGRSVSSKFPPRNWFLKRSISPPIPFSRPPPTTNYLEQQFYERDVNIIALFRPQTGDSIAKYTRLRRLQDSSKIENHYVHCEDGGSMSKKYSISHPRSLRLKASSKMEPSHNDERKPIFYVHRLSRGYRGLTPISLEDDGSLSNKYSISYPSEFDLNPEAFYSCNGLICYSDRTCDEHELFVWNPTTMETRKLPISPHTFEPPNDPHHIYNKVTIPFDTLTKVNAFVATWADPQSEDYKLLRFYTFRNFNDESYVSGRLCPMQLELYSLKTDSWKKLCWEEKPHSYGISRCYINGVIYMLPTNVSYNSVILSFNFHTETFLTLPFPTPWCIASRYELANCNEQLSLLRFQDTEPYSIYENFEIEHWVMSDGEWVCVSIYHDVRGVFRPLGFARNGELLLFASDDHSEPKFHFSVMVFDSTTRVMKHLPGLASRGFIRLLNFAETFVKLKPSGEQEKDGRAIQEQVIA